MSCLRVASHIRHVNINGFRIVLDLRSASYIILDEIASLLLSALLKEKSVGHVFIEIIKRYEVSEHDLAQDIKNFEVQCIATGLLIVHSEKSDLLVSGPSLLANVHRWPRVFHVMSAFYRLVATSWLLSRRGFYETYQYYGQSPIGMSNLNLDQAVRCFIFAENFYVSSRAPDDCLSRSLALFHYLRAKGFSAEHVIGVRRIPFRAHAWVECAGKPVIETHASQFTPLARLGGASVAKS